MLSSRRVDGLDAIPRVQALLDDGRHLPHRDLRAQESLVRDGDDPGPRHHRALERRHLPRSGRWLAVEWATK